MLARAGVRSSVFCLLFIVVITFLVAGCCLRLLFGLGWIAIVCWFDAA